LKNLEEAHPSDVPDRTNGRRPPAPFGVRARTDELRRRMQALGLTGAALARKANVAESTVSQARNGRRIHPLKLRAIAKALADVAQADPIPGAEALIDPDGQDAREAADG
jgi:transcriptional regulator with XRE-family HTH domain